MGAVNGIGLLSSLQVLILSGFIQRYLIRGFAMGPKQASSTIRPVGPLARSAAGLDTPASLGSGVGT